MLEFVKSRGVKEVAYLSQKQYPLVPLPAEKAILEIFKTIIDSGWVVQDTQP
jgi:hypothetical protein